MLFALHIPILFNFSWWSRGHSALPCLLCCRCSKSPTFTWTQHDVCY